MISFKFQILFFNTDIVILIKICEKINNFYSKSFLQGIFNDINLEVRINALW